MGIQVLALDALRDLYKLWGSARAGRVEQLQQYDTKLSAVRAFHEGKLKILWAAHPHAGDVFYVIEGDQDRAWRVQALLELGILRFSAETRGDRKKTAKLIERYCAGADEMEAAAARAARDLTEEEFNVLGTKGY